MSQERNEETEPTLPPTLGQWLYAASENHTRARILVAGQAIEGIIWMASTSADYVRVVTDRGIHIVPLHSVSSIEQPRPPSAPIEVPRAFPEGARGPTPFAKGPGGFVW